MKKIITIAAVAAVVVGGGAFYGGMKYAQGKGPMRGNFTNLTPEQRQQFAANAGGGFRGGQGGQRQGMGFIAGDIISKDDKSITIKMRDGGSKIIFYSDSTEIGKFTSGSIADLEVGNNVTANGAPNSDGSLTAQSIQIRSDQAMFTPKP